MQAVFIFLARCFSGPLDRSTTLWKIPNVNNKAEVSFLLILAVACILNIALLSTPMNIETSDWQLTHYLLAIVPMSVRSFAALLQVVYSWTKEIQCFSAHMDSDIYVEQQVCTSL